MCLRIPPDEDSSTTMFARKPSRPVAKGFVECTEELGRLYRVCRVELQGLYRQGLDFDDLRQLEQVQTSCRNWLRAMPLIKFTDSRIWEEVLELRKRVEQVLDAFSNLVIFSISSAEGGIYINIGSHTVHVPDNLRVNHPLLQMLLFADRKFHGGSFGCLKSMAPKSIVRMTKTSGSSASPAEYIAYWTANWKSESPNAVRSPRCGSKKPLLPVLFNISESKKTSSTVYDNSMAVAAWNCDKSNKSNLEPGKAGNRLLFQEESKNCQQHSALTGGSHDARLQVPTAAGSVKCGDTDENSRLTKQTSPQEQFILNSSADGGCGNPHSHRALRVTPFAEKVFTPMVPELIEVNPQHLRKIGLASEDDTLKAINIYMMEGSHGVSADRSMQYLTILDSGAAYHCTGDRSQLSDYRDGVEPVLYLRGAGGTVMRVHGTGSIHNENFQVKGVLYVPGLNNQPNISKTIFSVSKLNDLGFDILFNSDGTVSVMNLEHGIVGKAWNFRGLFMLDYLRIPDNRAPVAMLEGRRPGLVKSFWNASLSVWTSITSRLFQRAT